MVVVAEKLKHTIEEREVHIVEALVSRIDLDGSSNSGYRCCHKVH